MGSAQCKRLARGHQPYPILAGGAGGIPIAVAHEFNLGQLGERHLTGAENCGQSMADHASILRCHAVLPSRALVNYANKNGRSHFRLDYAFIGYWDLVLS